MAEITIRISDKALKITVAGLAAILLVWGVIQIESSGVLEPKFEINVFAPEANGIREGTPVRLDGMPVGKVSSVRLAEASADANRRIEVTLRIEKRYQDLVRTDSSASFPTNGLLGERSVEIYRGFSGPVINEREEIRTIPTKEIGTGDFLTALKKLSNCLRDENGEATGKSGGEATKPPVRK